MKGEKTMENMKYGVDYIYEKHGKLAIEKEILVDQAAYWKNCYEDAKKTADEAKAVLQKAVDEKEAEMQERVNFWFNAAEKRQEEIGKLKCEVDFLRERLAERDLAIERLCRECIESVEGGEGQMGDDF